MRTTRFLAGLAVLGLVASPATAGDGLSKGARLAPAAQNPRAPSPYTMLVGQGAGIDLPTVAVDLSGDPLQRYMILAEASGAGPFLVTGGVLDETGAAERLLDLPAEVLEVPLVFRAGFLRPGGPVFSDPEPLTLPQQTDCQVEDWEDHDCGFGAGCDPQGDGDSPAAEGEIVTGQWVDEWGVVSVDNDKPDFPDFAVLFDSSDPTGGDTDLGTPLFDGGDGCFADDDGGGGGPIGPGDPCKPYDLVLIIQENTTGCEDGFCDVPDDEGWGGFITLDFRFQVEMCWMDLLDVDEADGATVRTFCDHCEADSGEVIWVPPGGDHSLRRVFFSAKCVDRVEVDFSGSGAIAEFAYQFCDIITH